MMKKIIWNDEKEFAFDIKEILLYRGFKIDGYYDDIGPDGGRDIEAHTFEYDSALNEYDSTNWWIELKFRSKSSIGVKDIDDIRSKITRAIQSKVNKFLLITNTQYTPEFKANISDYCYENNIKIRYWDITILEKLFFDKENEIAMHDYHANLISDRLNDTKLIFNTIKSGLKSVFFLIGSAGVGKSALARYVLSYVSNSKKYASGILDLQLQGGIGFQLKILAENFRKQRFTSDFCFSANLSKNEYERIELLFEHCLTNESIIVIDNMEKALNINGNIENKFIKELVNKFLCHNMNGSVLLLLSRMPLNRIYNTNQLFFSHELKGWDIDFVYEKYLPYLQYLNTCISNIANTEKRKQLLQTMEGNPLALKIADRLCVSNDIEDVINCVEDKNNPAQSLISFVSDDLLDAEIIALNKFAQFNRPMSEKEIFQFVCSKQMLNRLKIRMLIEPLSVSNAQYSMHPLIIAQFNLRSDLEKRKRIVGEVTSAIMKSLENKNIDEIYNHGLLRQVAEMFLSINDVNQAAEIIIRIGTRALSMGDVIYLTSMLNRLFNNHDLKPLFRTRLKKAEAHAHDFNNSYDLAEKTYKKMLKEAIDLKDAWSRAAALNGLGSIERFRNNCEKAISLYTESLQIRIDNHFTIDESNSHHNLGAVYIITEEYDKAIEHLEKAKEIRKKENDIFRVSATELYLGESYIHKKNYEKANILLTECVKNKKAVHDVVGSIWANLAMGKLIICESIEKLSNKKLEKNILNLKDIARVCENISHIKEYVIAQIFMSISSLLLNEDTENVMEYLVNAQANVKNTLLADFYGTIIKDLMNIAFNNVINSDDLILLAQTAIKIKI